MGVVIRHLPVKLTEEEVAVRAAELARVTTERAELEKVKAAYNKAVARNIRLQQSRIAHLSAIVMTATELRDVECYEVIDVANGTVSIHRSDTKAVVDSRPLTDADRQKSLHEVH